MSGKAFRRITTNAVVRTMSELRELAGACEYIERAMAGSSTVGAAVAVVRGTEIIYVRGFGLRQFGRNAKIDPDTLFQVGSTTKAFTTAALGILVDEGRLLWDDPVIEHLPDFQLQDPWMTRHLTIRDAVTHRSGILGNGYPYLGIVDSKEAIRHLRHGAPVGQFRDSYCYSNLMYALAGNVIEAVSGESWGEFIERRLLKPLEMHRTGSSPYKFWEAPNVSPTLFGTAPSASFDMERAREKNLAMPHGWDEKGSVTVLPWRSYDNAAAAGALVSSAADMANWLILHLQDGCFKGTRVLTRDTATELHTLQNLKSEQLAQKPPFPEEVEGYAMGWRRGRYRGYIHLAHGGGIIGFPSYAAFIPDAKVGVVVLSNGPRSARDQYALNKAIGFWLFDQVLGEPAHDWSRECIAWLQRIHQLAENEEAELRPGRRSQAPPSLSFEQYAGVYEDRIGESGSVRVSVENGGLRFSFPGAGAFAAVLEPWHFDLFRMCSSPAIDEMLDLKGTQARFVEFSLDPKGRVGSMNALGARFLRQLE